MTNYETAFIKTDQNLNPLVQALHESLVSVVITDTHSTIVYVNEFFCKLTGYTPDEVLGKPARLLQSGKQPDSFYKSMWAALFEGKTWRGEFHNKKKNGELFWEMASITPLKNDDGIVTHYIAIKDDITGRIEAENRLKQTNQKLASALQSLSEKENQLVHQERLRALGQMASGVAHDFNNALQPILLAAGMLDADEDILGPNPEARGYVKDILTAARDAAHTVRRLVRFYSKSDRDELVPVDLKTLIPDVLELTRYMWKEEASSRGVQIEVNTHIGRPCIIKGVPEELREVVVNLVFNAVDAIEDKGTITVSCKQEKGSVVLEVADDGVGMEKEVKEKCLEPFFTTKKSRGSGLGLSIVHGILKRHDAEITFDSDSQTGTRVRILFSAFSEHDEQPVLEMASDSISHPVGKWRILLVDDDFLVANAMEKLLLSMGHTVVKACSGTDGKLKFEEAQYDLVITDQAMAEYSGLKLAAFIKERRPLMKIIMLTGFSELRSESVEDLANVDELLVKPILKADLAAALNNVMQ